MSNSRKGQVLLLCSALWLAFSLSGCSLIQRLFGPEPEPEPEPEPNTPPTAMIESYAPLGMVGESLTFDGSASVDPDEGDQLTYSWDFGDGTSAEGMIVDHIYDVADIYIVQLTVTDGEGESSVFEFAVIIDEVINVSPSSSIGTTKTITSVVGDSVDFDGTGSEDPDPEDTLAYDWDFGDGTSGAGALTSHVYGSSGVFIVSLTVTDTAGNSDDDSMAVFIQAPPVAEAVIKDNGGETTLITVFPGEEVTFDGSRSYDEDGAVASYMWNFGDGATSALAEPSHAYDYPGDYTATLSVTDDDGLTSDTAIVTVVVEHRPPVADAGSNINIDTTAVGSGFVLDGSGSAPFDDLTFSWEVVDNADVDGTGPGPWTFPGAITNVTTITAAGYYTATLTVTNPVGTTDSDSIAIIIADLTTPDSNPPVAAVAPPPSDPDALLALSEEEPQTAPALRADPPGTPPTVYVLKGRNVTFDASRSFDTGGQQTGETFVYDWDFGDGTTQPDAGAVYTYAYATASATAYEVTFTVTDGDSPPTSDTITACYVRVLEPPNKPPVADAGAGQEAEEGDTVFFDGSGSDDPDGVITEYAWDFGDGSTPVTGAGSGASYVYPNPGVYLVKLTVTDNGESQSKLEKSDDDTMRVVVKKAYVNLPPIADAGSDKRVLVDTAVQLNGSRSFDADGSITNYSWDFGDGTSNAGADLAMPPVHTYDAPGEYIVTLRVTDDSGDTATELGEDQITVKVVEPPPAAFSIKLAYTGPNGFSDEHPIILSVYEIDVDPETGVPTGTWINTTPVVVREATSPGIFAIPVTEIPEFDLNDASRAYAVFVLHQVTATSDPEMNFWAVLDEGAPNNLGYDLGSFTPIEPNTPVPYSITVVDGNTGSLEVVAW